MRTNDLFVDDRLGGTSNLNGALIEQLEKGPVAGYEETSVASALTDLAHNEFQAFGTSGGESLDNEEIFRVVRALQAVTKRLGIEFEPPFDNFNRFKSYWLKNSGYGSWQARRDMLDSLFNPLTARISRVEEDTIEGLVSPVSPRTVTGWHEVDDEIHELRRRFSTSTSPQDYRALGTYCMGVVESVSLVAYDSAKHVRAGETELPRDKTKLRLDRIVETALPGRSNEALRSLAKASVTAAHRVKHATSPTRMEAGIAADTVILLANIIRRLHLGEVADQS